MGVVLAVSPIAGQLFGAKRPAEAGRQFHQALWLALGLLGAGLSLVAVVQVMIALLPLRRF